MILHDKDIREPLFDYLEEAFGKIRILEEKTMGRSRADVIMVTETALVGIEIKSDADSYTRLARQIKDYDKYFDYNIAVVGTTHALHIREHLPEYWGVITVEPVEGACDFYILKKPSPNPHVHFDRQLEMLWRSELLKLLQWNQMPKYSNRGKAFVIRKLLERLEMGLIEKNTLKTQVSELLFERDYTIFDSGFF